MNMRFSVAMSVYKKDSPEHFDHALESIIVNQTVKPSEIILVVDGPVPTSINDVIKRYDREYPSLFTIIRLEKNGGLGNALRIAIERAANELIARMDSDDVSVPNRFEQQLAMFHADNKLDIVGGDITEFDGDERNIIGKRMVPQGTDQIYTYMKTRCAMNHVTVMYKRTAVLAAGGYIDWFWNEDYYLWIRMMLNKAVFSNTGTVLVNVRSGEEQYRRRGGIKYFQSEKGLQDIMLKNHIIGYGTYLTNVCKRLVVQVLLPNKLRGMVFHMFAREKAE